MNKLYIAKEAAKIKLDYPGMTYTAAIEQAKEVCRAKVSNSRNTTKQ